MPKQKITPFELSSLPPKDTGDSIVQNTAILQIQHRIIGLIFDKHPELLTDEIEDLYKLSTSYIKSNTY